MCACVWISVGVTKQTRGEIERQRREGNIKKEKGPEKTDTKEAHQHHSTSAPTTHLGLVPRGVRHLDPRIETQCTGHVAFVECSVSQRHACLLKQRTLIRGPGWAGFGSGGAIFGDLSEGVPFREDVDYYVPVMAAPLQ